MGRLTQICFVFAVLIAALAFLILTAGASEIADPPQVGEDLPPAGIDLDVTLISRTPLYSAYCVEYLHDAPNQPGRPILCPGSEVDRRWPEPGEIVTFAAHVVNKGTDTSPSFDYAWAIDGIEVASGELEALAEGAEVIATLQWPWPHGLSGDGQRALGEHTVRFTADTDNAVAETCEDNNTLEDPTQAMSFQIYLTPEMYAAYNVPVTDTLPYSAEDWLQKQIAAMNASFANAIYPVTPQGSSLRVRINTLGIASAYPGADGEHDGGWFIDADYRHGASGYYDPATDIDWGLVHELSHQVSIIDLYAIGVYAANVTVTGRAGMPANMGFGWSNGGLMGGGDISPYSDHNLYSSHSAAGSSTYAGYRNGYYGSYQFDLPLDNYLRILDSSGDPAPGVHIALYQRAGPWDWTGHLGVDHTPESSGTTDSQGVLWLPNRPANGGTVTANGHVLHDNPFGVVDIIGNQGLFLVQLGQDGHEEFHWLDITQFNLAYWMGDVISHTFTLSSHVPPPGAPAAPEILAVRVEGTWASLDWQPSPSREVVGYRVYRASAPRYRYTAAGGLLTGTHFEEFSAEFDDGEHRIYAVTAVDSDGRESGFGELVYVPGLGAPTAVALAADGSRTVLNNWNLYPLLRQRADGRYTHRLVNVHYDLGDAKYLAYDPAGHLLVSGFGEFPESRPAVRVYDQAMQPLWALGDEGSEPGQFVEPSGVASWGGICTIGGPYEEDSHTLLLLHLEGNHDGIQGEMGSATNTEFVAGRYGQGVLMDGTDTLTYTTAGNLNHTWGAVELWLRPAWDGDDEGTHTLFWWGDAGGRLHLRKDPISNLVFDYFHESGGCGAATSVSAWRAGEWHHIAFSWDETRLRLYVDEKLVDENMCGGTAQPTAPHFYIGSRPEGAESIEATIDELRISDVPRLGNSDSCGRILVADGGLHRIQAFDGKGGFLSAYGSLGSNPGEFNYPQGVAVDHSGRVIVADQGNNRLVVLEFDGTEFSYLGSFEADFDAPSTVAVGAWGHIVVADTGNNRVVVLDPQGNFLAEYTEPNDGYTGPFNAPLGVAAELDGDLVVADTGNQRVVTVRGALPYHGLWLPLVLGGSGVR